MARSSFFEELVSRIQILETKFLTKQLADETENPLTFNPDPESLAAFRMLAHAEIEDYLERKARNSLEAIERDFTGSSMARPTMQLYALANHFKIFLPHECPFDTAQYQKSVQLVIEASRKFLSDNNGIKATTFVTVCVIIGINILDLDSALAAKLNSYGEARGQVAHKGTKRVTGILAPSVERNNVLEILRALEEFFYSGV